MRLTKADYLVEKLQGKLQVIGLMLDKDRWGTMRSGMTMPLDGRVRPNDHIRTRDDACVFFQENPGSEKFLAFVDESFREWKTRMQENGRPQKIEPA